MDVHFSAELERKLIDLAAQTGRRPDEVVQDVMTTYLNEVAGVHAVLDTRFDHLEADRVEPVDGESFFDHLR